jgi:hypothetical protein
MNKLQSLYLRYGGANTVRIALIAMFVIIALAAATPVGAARYIPCPEGNGSTMI